MKVILKIEVDLPFPIAAGVKVVGIEPVTAKTFDGRPRMHEYVVAGNYQQFCEYIRTRPSWVDFIAVTEGGHQLMGVNRPVVRFVGTYYDRKDVLDIVSYLRVHNGTWFCE